MKLVTSFATISIILMATNQSHSLSCVRDGFDMEATFKANKTAGNNTVFVFGHFSGKQTPQPKRKNIIAKDTNVISPIQHHPNGSVSNLSFSGKVMTKNGAKPFNQKVKVTVTCAASWCGNIPKSGKKTIAALTKTASGYTMTAGPCSPNTFSGQVQKDWQKLKRLVR